MYLVYAKEKQEGNESTLNRLDQERLEFLKQYKDCFSKALPTELPPERPEDHAILEIPGSSPPNRVPYRVSAA